MTAQNLTKKWVLLWTHTKSIWKKFNKLLNLNQKHPNKMLGCFCSPITHWWGHVLQPVHAASGWTIRRPSLWNTQKYTSSVWHHRRFLPREPAIRNCGWYEGACQVFAEVPQSGHCWDFHLDPEWNLDAEFVQFLRTRKSSRSSPLRLLLLWFSLPYESSFLMAHVIKTARKFFLQSYYTI